MSFMDFTADFITDVSAIFIMDFTANVKSIKLYYSFYCKFHYVYDNFTKINKISLKCQVGGHLEKGGKRGHFSGKGGQKEDIFL